MDRNIFSDKATLIPRRMLREPERGWVVRDFTGPGGVSLGMAQEVLEAMARRGYVEREKKGPRSRTRLTQPNLLLQDWLKDYRFEYNGRVTYYSHRSDLLSRIRTRLKQDRYALTLHAGANLVTGYVRTDDIHLYLEAPDWDRRVREHAQALDLKELARGGNVHFVRPWYKRSVWEMARTLRGYPVVSDLQLYIDLYHFQPRGREHAERLAHLLERKGKILA